MDGVLKYITDLFLYFWFSFFVALLDTDRLSQRVWVNIITGLLKLNSKDLSSS